jgi:hypothetical protein
VKPAEPIDLLTGAKWSYSLDAGKTFSSTHPTIKAKTTVYLQARTEFDVADTAGMVVLELTSRRAKTSCQPKSGSRTVQKTKTIN